MASSSNGFSRLGFCFGVLSCLVFVLQTGLANNLQSPPVVSAGPLKVSQLPQATSEFSGLSPYIQPVTQNISVVVEYPLSTYNPYKDHTTYRGDVEIQFRCTEPTNRIVTHGNLEWIFQKVEVSVFGTDEKLVIKELLFNRQDETLYVDLVENLKTEGTYRLFIILGSGHIIDQDDRFGIQAFNRTQEGTSRDIITASLSGAPKAMRHLVPCFDDPAYKMPYSWQVTVIFGVYHAGMAMMNAPRDYVSYNCGMDPFFRIGWYDFEFPPMAIESTQLRIVPFSWYPDNDSPRPPPEHCV